MRTVIKAIPERYLTNVVIVGTLRYIQLAVLRYVNNIMFLEAEETAVPTFDHIEVAINGRLFRMLPGLPAGYIVPTIVPPLPLPPPPLGIPPPHGIPPHTWGSTPTGNQILAPNHEKNKALMDAFAANSKSIQQLRNLPNPPKEKKGPESYASHITYVACALIVAGALQHIENWKKEKTTTSKPSSQSTSDN